MSGADLIQVRLTQFGDIVYFSVFAEAGEEMVWTSALERLTKYKLTPKSQVQDAMLALFRIDSYSAPGETGEAEARRGQVVKPGALIKLFHILKNQFVTHGTGALVLGLDFSDDKAAPLGISIYSPRAVIGAGLQNEDVVSLLAQPETNPMLLAKDFLFKGASEDRWVVHRFEKYTPKQENCLKYGEMCKLRSNNLMYLSVLPNFNNSDTLLLADDQLDEHFQDKKENLCFPEYQGPLKADLTSDADDGNNYWVLERENKFLGEALESSKDFYLRHIASGRYLKGDMTLVQKDEAQKFQFRSLESDTIGFGELQDLTQDENKVMSLDYTPTLESAKSQVFQSVISEIRPNSVLRLPLCGSSTQNQLNHLKFAVQHVSLEDSRVVLTLSQYSHLLSEMRLALQHLKKLPDAHQTLDKIDDRISMDYLNMPDNDYLLRANLASDLQVANEGLRILVLKEFYKEEFKEAFKNILVLSTIENKWISIQYFERVSRNIFARKEMLTNMIKIGPVTIADIVEWALRSHPPGESERMYWAEVFMTLGLNLTTYSQHSNINYFTHRLLDRIEDKMLAKHVDIIREKDKYILEFKREGGSFNVRTFEKMRSLEDLLENVEFFALATLQLAADLCLHSTFKGEIVIGMGLDVDSTVRLYNLAAQNLDVKLGLLYFIAIVHIPDCAKGVTLSKVTEGRLLELEELKAPEPENKSDWFYFPENESPLAQLVKDEVYFWLSTVHLPIKVSEGVWYGRIVIRFRMIEELIEHDAVSDIFVVSMVTSAVAVTRWVLGDTVPGFSERFPDINHSKYRVEAQKNTLLEEFLELMSAYQRWKQVKVLKRLAREAVTNITQETIQRYLKELDFSYLFTEYCRKQGISLVDNKPEDQTLLTVDMPVLARSLNNLLQNPSLSPVSILFHIFKNTHYTCRGRPTQLLNLVDNEIDMSHLLLQYFTEVSHKSPYLDLFRYIEDIRSRKVSIRELETLKSTDVRNLTECVQAMETLTNFLLSIKDDKEAFQNMQVFLNKTDFIKDLERMWFRCIAIGPTHIEDPLSVQYRTLTIELSRLYIYHNDFHRKQLLRVLPTGAFFPDYPQYLRLLMELGLLDSGGEVARILGQLVFEFATKSDKKRPILAIKELLKNEAMLSRLVFTIVDYYQKIEKESLTSCEWAVLTVLSQAVAPEQRLKWFGKFVEKWYEKSPEDSRRDGAALIILAADTKSATFKAALGKVVSSLGTLNQKDLETISSYFKPLMDTPHTLRDRNFEDANTDLRYLIEVQWDKDAGVFSHIPLWMPKITLMNITRELSKLYLTIAPAENLRYFASTLYPVLSKYGTETDDKLDPSNRERLDQVIKTKVEPPEVMPRSTISVPSSQLIVTVISPPQDTRPLISQLFAQDEVIAPKHFTQLETWFLSKQAKIDYLHGCEKAAQLLNSKTYEGNEVDLMPVVNKLLDLAVERSNAQLQCSALSTVTTIIQKVQGVRVHFIQFLRQRRRYLQVFGVFANLLYKRNKLRVQGNDNTTVIGDFEKMILQETFKQVDMALSAFLSLFQYCCDGCFFPFQEYLRDQGEGAQNSINVVALTCELMTKSMEDLGKADEVVLATNCASFLFEAVSGPCMENQKTVCRIEKFLLHIMKFVEDLSQNKPNEDVGRLMSKSLQLILALLEGRERNTEKIQEVMASVDFSLFERLALKFSAMITPENLSDIRLGTCTDEDIQVKFDFVIQCIIICFETIEEDKLLAFKDLPLMEYVASVEIETEDPATLQPVIRSLAFRIPTICQFLTSDTAYRLLFEIDRESRQVKLDDFTNKISTCQVEMEHQQAISRHRGLKYFTRWWKFYWFASFGFVVLINLLLVMVVQVNGNSRFHLEGVWSVLLKPFSLAQVFLCVSGTISYYVEYFHVLKKPLKKRDDAKEIQSSGNPGSLASYFTTITTGPPPEYDVNELLKALIRVVYTCVACISVFFPVFYPVLLLQIVNLNDSVVNILRSVTERGSQLMLTLVFALMAIYIFTFVAYFFLYDYYNSDSGLFCDSLSDCFFSTVNLGMRSGGGIGDAFGPTHSDDFGFRLVFDLLFYIFITTVLMAIVFGLIVDTFSELRDEQNSTEFDMSNICFICGKSRSIIELKGEGWHKHTMSVHNPFAYVYFLIHLNQTDILDCSGIEKIVKEKHEAMDISFYPSSSAVLGLDLESED